MVRVVAMSNIAFKGGRTIMAAYDGASLVRIAATVCFQMSSCIAVAMASSRYAASTSGSLR